MKYWLSLAMAVGWLVASHSTIRASADVPFAVARTVMLSETEELRDGSLVVFSDDHYQLSHQAYDESLVGVVELQPAVEIDLLGDQGVPLVSSGQAFVLVNTSNGEIQAGDLLTSSVTPGVGMKATEAGWVIGKAMESYVANETGSVLVSINIHYHLGAIDVTEISNEGEPVLQIVRHSLTDMFKVFSGLASEQPSVLFRYILASVVLIVSVVFSYFTFGKVARSGIEAIGRNPLASKSISFGIAMNVGVAGMIVFAGLVVAYYIIRL